MNKKPKTVDRNDPTYSAWMNMRQRCNNPKHPDFRSYSTLGITYCPDWTDFQVFKSDMGEKPKGHILHRLDYTKGFSLENCRWSTRK